MSELKARNSSELKSFSATELLAFGRRVSIFHEFFIQSTFRIALEIDRVEVFNIGGSQLSTIPSNSITRIVFNDGLKLLMRFGLLKHDPNPPPLIDARIDTADLLDGASPFAMTRADATVRDGQNSFIKETNDNWRMHALLPDNIVPHKMLGTTRTLTVTGATLSFDTIDTYLRQIPFQTIRGFGIMQTASDFDDTADAVAAWHWPPELTPSGFHEFRHFGRIIYESL